MSTLRVCTCVCLCGTALKYLKGPEQATLIFNELHLREVPSGVQGPFSGAVLHPSPPIRTSIKM